MGGSVVHSSSIVPKRLAKSDPRGQVFELKDFDVEEVSIVDRAANKRKFLVVKGISHMPTELNKDGKGGFTTKGRAGTIKMDVPPGFKEMATPLLEKAQEALQAAVAELSSAKPAEVGDDGSVPGVPAEFVSSLQNVMSMLDRAANLMPAGEPEMPEGEAGEEPPAEVPEEEPTEMQMRMVVDGVAKVLGSKRLSKATARGAIAKIGAKMSKDRYARLQQAAQVLSNLIAELSPAPPTGTPAVGKTAKSDPGTPEATTPAAGAEVSQVVAQAVAPIQAQLTELAGVVKRLAGVVTSQGASLSSVAKSRPAPAALSVEQGGEPPGQGSGFSWPMDMNSPFTRESVGKGPSFFDE